MRSHEVDYQVYGDDLQFVEIELDPGETVIAEAGTMMFLEQGITHDLPEGRVSGRCVGNVGGNRIQQEARRRTVRGRTGWVWLQSLPFNRLADRLVANLRPGGSQGEGSMIGGLSTIFENR